MHDAILDRYGAAIRDLTRSITSVICSAPSRPLRARLRKVRESGDVDEEGGAVGFPCTRIGISDQMLLQDAGDVAACAIGHSGRRCLSLRGLRCVGAFGHE